MAMKHYMETISLSPDQLLKRQSNRINVPDLRLQHSKADFAIETRERPGLQTVRAAPPGRS